MMNLTRLSGVDESSLRDIDMSSVHNVADLSVDILLETLDHRVQVLHELSLT